MFSVLVDYHNDLLGLLEQEIQVNGGALGLGSLAEILSKLADEEVSIVQIAQERMGVVALNETDCQWIEQLSRASLENENRYFPKLDTSLNFNFLYVQAHLIRSYLLLCRINYKHIQGRYQCYAKRHDAVTTTLDRDGDHETDLRLTDEWNHLEYANLNQLHNEHRLLQRIADVVRNATEDFSKVNLSTFMRDSDYGHRFAQQFQEYQIKDFPLHQIDDVCRFYEKMINNYQHAFIDAPRLLRVPLDDTLSNELDQIFQSSFLPSTEVSDKVEFEKKIQTINEFLSDLKEAENSLGSKSAQSLAEICQQWHIDNPIVHLIPREIKCENYVPLCQKLSDLRSQLRKHANEIEEKSIEQWSACFDRSTTSQSIPNSFHMSREPPSPPIIPDPPSPSVEPPTPTPREKLDTENPSVEIQDLFSPTRPTTPRPTTPVPQLKSNDYVSLVTLKIQSVSLPPSALFESSRLIADGLPTQEAAVRIHITHLDGSPEKHHLKAHKVHDQLRKSFVQKRYDLHSMAIIDQYKLCVDYMTEPTNDLLPIRSAEYRVIERTALVSIILSFERHQLNYSATSQAQISSILARFIVDQKLTFTPSDTYFNVYDQQGKYLFEDSPISQIYRSDEQAPIRVQILRSESNTSTFAEVTLTKDHEGMCLYSFYRGGIQTCTSVQLWNHESSSSTQSPHGNR